MYTADLADFVGERQVNFYSFADDSLTYLHCSLGDIDSVVCQCITEVGHWMSANHLKLSTDKTELASTGSRHNPSLLRGCGPFLQLDDYVIQVACNTSSSAMAESRASSAISRVNSETDNHCLKGCLLYTSPSPRDS